MSFKYDALLFLKEEFQMGDGFDTGPPLHLSVTMPRQNVYAPVPMQDLDLAFSAMNCTTRQERPPERLPLPVSAGRGFKITDSPQQYILVNGKQHKRIVLRRQVRAKLVQENKVVKRKDYLHESRHLHALRRLRGDGGRFVNTKLKPEQKPSKEPESESETDSIQSFLKDSEHDGAQACDGSGGTRARKSSREMDIC